MWYLDCFTEVDEINKHFPVNTYCDHNLSEVLEAARRVLTNPISGIESVRISQTTNGMAPIGLSEFTVD